jgi:nitroreductase/predicted transcriptional regulator YdeE
MLKPRFVEKERFTVAGVAVAGQLGEFNYAEIWEKRYMAIDALLQPYRKNEGYCGITFNEGDHLVYLAGVAVEEVRDLPQGVEMREIPAAKYAVFDCVFNSLAEMMQEIYGQWFHACGLQPDNDAFSFEYYPPYSGEGEMQVEMYIPIKPKENASNKQGSSMKVIEAITNRRSIRKFKSDLISDEALRQILKAGSLAPSGKNRQPWKFYVVQGDKCAEMVAQMRSGINQREKEGMNVGSAKYTLKVMEQAPVTVFVFNPDGLPLSLVKSIDQHLSAVVDIQSIGAAIQNTLLAAEELGLGSLWICDVYYAYEELSTWLGEHSEMIAAISFGVADEHPVARKRKPFEEVVHWV